MKLIFGMANERRLAVFVLLEFGDDAGTDDLLRRNAIGFFRDRAHECNAAAGDDEGLEAVGTQVGEQFKLGLIDAFGVGRLNLGCFVVASQLLG